MRLFYDARDQQHADRRGDRRLYWLDDLGAAPLDEARPEDEGFLFAGARPIDDYERLVAGLPHVRDRPTDRGPLLRLDHVLDALARAGVTVPTPRTWRLALDAPLPRDLRYPLFLRTPLSSWKLGGRISRVDDQPGLLAECEALRRAFQWDATILAREWLDLAPAGESPYGPVPPLQAAPRAAPASGDQEAQGGQLAGAGAVRRARGDHRERAAAGRVARLVANSAFRLPAAQDDRTGLPHSLLIRATPA